MGSGADVSATTNIGPITDMSAPVGAPVPWASVSTGTLLSWPGKMTYDAATGKVYVVACGAGHASDVPAGLETKELTFDMNGATGTFSARWGQTNVFPKNVGHVYDTNPSRLLNGVLYRRPYGDNIVYSAAMPGGAWSAFKDISSWGFTTEAGFDVFPSMGASGSLIYCYGGQVYRLNVADLAMSVIGSVGGAGTSYHVCAYHAGIDAMVVGGGIAPGTGLYKVNSAGTITLITNTLPGSVPAIGPNGTTAVTLLPDPQGGTVAYLMDSLTTGHWWRLDLNAGTWTDMGALPAILSAMDSVCWASLTGQGSLLGFSGRGNADASNNNSNAVLMRVA